MRRSATWSGLLLCLLIVQAMAPLTGAWSSRDDISVTQDDTEAPLGLLEQMNIRPIADSAHGWGELDSDVYAVGLIHRDAAPVPISDWVDSTGQRSVDGWVILQHQWPVPTEWFGDLAKAGIECYSFLPPASFHCNVPKMSPTKLKSLEVLAVMKLDPTDKVHPNLPAMMLGQEEWDTVKENYGTFNLVLSGTELPDLPGINVFSHNERWATVATDNAGIAKISSSEAVEWIEPLPVYQYTNEVADEVLNTSWVASNMASVNSSWSDLDGSGIIVTVTDSGLHNGVNDSEMHGDFSDHITGIVSFPIPTSSQGSCSSNSVFDDGASDTHSHGTHVAGSVLGDGTNSSGLIKGSAPEANLLFQAFEQICNGAYILALPNNLKDFMDLAAENNSNVHTNSWSSMTCASCFGEYNSGTMQVDTASNAYPNMTILFAAGNSGTDSNSNGEIDDDSLGSPATGKNVITVGASENNRPIVYTDAGSGSSTNTDNISGMATFSSRGPTDDGRQKPDISAPGTYILSTKSNYARAATECGWGYLPISDANNAHYCYKGGTSMATPLTAGVAALLYQHLYDNVGHENVSSSLIKAIMTANANDMMGQYSDVTNGAGEDAPNYHEGWGRLNIRAAVDTSFVDNEGVATGEERAYSFAVPSSAPDMRLMLVWTDPASSPGAGPHLVNQLNLNIKKPDGSWVNDTNTLDNIIGADFASPAVGTWEVHITGASVPTGPQMFSVAISANYTLVNLTQDADVDGVIDGDDDCLNTFGNSTEDRQGCPDSDGDGYSNPDPGAPAHPTGSADAFPNEPTQWENTDGDAYGDNPAGITPDDCTTESGTSTIDRTGCPDDDSDGYSNPDAGWTTAQGADGCTSAVGNSTEDRFGCPDGDGDGWSNPDGSAPAHPVGIADAFLSEKTQWQDSDGDGYGDNWANTSWNSSRENASTPVGQWYDNAYQPDDCPDVGGGMIPSSYNDRYGCADNDGDGWSNPDAEHPAHPVGHADAFPTEPTQWNDTDGDGFGDSSSGTNGDDCPAVAGSSIVVGSIGCADTDSDGVPDNVDVFPDDATQSADSDGDGYGDDPDGTNGDDCPSVSGNSFEGGTFGCLDSDLDGWANLIDAFPNEITQWNDTDSDGYGDNGAGFEGDGCPTEVGSSTLDVLGCPDSDGDGYSDDGDAFDDENEQWLDSDGDGYGDNPSPAALYDDCPTVYGNSTADRQGCYDSDGDTYSNPTDGWDWSDGADAFPDDILRWVDDDQDQFDDLLDDDCDTLAGTSTLDRKGCPDSDGDGYSDPGSGWSPADGADAFPNLASQWNDTDGDGYGDNQTGLSPDACPSSGGNSTLDRLGCTDSDGDGYSNSDAVFLAHPNGEADAFPNDVTQWEDNDSDGFGDNPQGTTADDCPEIAGNSSIGRYGCSDSDGDGVPEAYNFSWTIAMGADAFPNESSQWIDLDSDGFGDNPNGSQADTCPSSPGDSTGGGKYGCIDSDRDGWADEFDAFPTVISQWADSDGDGFGDNISSGAVMVDHWPNDANKNVAEVDISCSPDSIDTTLASLEEIAISCTVTNAMSSSLVIVLKWQFPGGVTATLSQRAVFLGASGSSDATASVTFTGRANSAGQIDTSILAFEPGGTTAMDIESFIINVEGVQISNVTAPSENTNDSLNDGWSKYIPIDPNDPSLTIPFLAAVVLSLLFIVRRIKVSQRKQLQKLSDGAAFTVEQERMTLKHSSSVLERPPPPLVRNVNFKR